MRRPPQYWLGNVKAVIGLRHDVDEVLAIAEIERRAGIARGRIEHVAVQPDQCELNHVAGRDAGLVRPELQAEGQRILGVKCAHHQQRLIDALEDALGVFLEQFGDAVAVRPRLLDRVRPLGRGDCEIADPDQGQEEQCDLQRTIPQDRSSGFADCPCGNHDARPRFGRQGRTALAPSDGIALSPPRLHRDTRGRKRRAGAVHSAKLGGTALSFCLDKAQFFSL
ncbi:hypothetical protein [Bradyrhizobium sp. WSM1743]|uniref:hypothetical protein n=1 Tax=Bradyrhizobium sp. WSM1743 TaxID=318996 RepID=UPI000A06097E|nr:hypothetical protein [Bradyrhizobium sp. WSM1743]